MFFRQKAVARAVDKTLPTELRSKAIEALAAYTYGGAIDNAYTRLLIIELSRGDLSKLRELVNLAIQDPRDVLGLHRDHK